MDRKMRNYVRKHRDEVTGFDKFCGFCGGIAAYKVTKAILSDISKKGGLFTKTGCFVIEVVVGLGVGEMLTETVQDRRLRLDYILGESEDVSDSNEETEEIE